MKYNNVDFKMDIETNKVNKRTLFNETRQYNIHIFDKTIFLKYCSFLTLFVLMDRFGGNAYNYRMHEDVYKCVLYPETGSNN